MSVKEYLEQSLSADAPDALCRGWKYLEQSPPNELKAILARPEYWALEYNKPKQEFIIKELGLDLTPELRKQLDSFVYIFNCKRRDEAKAQEERDILARGYTKIDHAQKELDGKKVKGIFNISTLGLLGSFNKLTELEGTLRYAERFNALMIMPKRSRTKGYMIRDFAYIKNEVV